MSYILAQYTIRSKQDYIFRSNRVVEIIGASDNISKSWDVLFEQACKIGIIAKKIEEQSTFDMEAIKKEFDDKTLNMVELFRGGGNDTVLFDSEDSYKAVNQAFSYYLLENFPGMIPMAVCYKYTGDYQADYKQLMQEAEREKNCMVSGQSNFILPFSMMDRNTFQPYSRVKRYENKPVRITEESYRKRKPGIEISKKDYNVKILDDIVTQKGNESLLAVIHADGNNMGIKIENMLKGITDYNTCILKMRQFTADTANAFITEGMEAMERCQKELREKYKNKYKEKAYLYRKIIADGDDMTFICNARFAMEYVKAYLESVHTYQERHHSEWHYSSCAGICIFHSHYPFARAYSMAEQACDDSAKDKVHGSKGQLIEESWVDFHYIHNGIGGDLQSVRDHQGTAACMARPWLIEGGSSDDSRHYGSLLKLNDLFSKYDVSRGDIKTIGSEYESSPSDGERELIRVYGHHKGLKESVEEKYPNKQQLLKMLYDLSEIYDLWFKEGR